MSLDYSNPSKYIGNYQDCFIGYSMDQGIRSGAASGGVVTAMLIYQLEKGYIQGALVSKHVVEEGKLSYKTFIAQTREELMACRTSIYMDFPLAKHFKDILTFDGKVAVVALPCQMQVLKKLEFVYPELSEKIALKIALFCSGNPSPVLTEKILEKNKISIVEVEKLYFRKGHWRGKTHIEQKDGTAKSISYLYNHCTYKNLYFHSLPRCYSCQDHFGYNADISCGDVWLKEMKDNPIKHTGFVAKSGRAMKLIEEMTADKALYSEQVEGTRILKSQKRALMYKYATGKAKMRIGKWFGLAYHGKQIDTSKWNHYLAVFFISLNIRWAQHPFWGRVAFKLPRRLMFIYMGFIRFLLND